MTEGDRPTLRVDKWLWQTRFFKTRQLAAEVVQSGRLRIDGQRISKPGRAIGPGAVLTFPQAKRVRVIKVLDVPERRGPASEARTHYEDLDPPADEADVICD